MTKKQKFPESINNLKIQLEKENNLVDYFLVCGVRPSICQDESLYNLNNENSIESKEINPEIISKCPPFDKSTISIDDGILKFCFPKGFKITYSKEQPEPMEFSFILDNQFFSYEYPQKYVNCILFYESLSKYKKLQMKIQNFNTESVGLDDTASTISSYSNGNFGNRSVILENKSQQKINQYYIPKCICLVSVYPYISWNSYILKAFYEYSTSSPGIPIEKIVQNLVIEVPAPPRGLYSIEYFIVNRKIDLKQNDMRFLPLVNFPLEIIWNKFSFSQITDILKHLLLETKLIFFSSCINDLCYTILSFLQFIFPLKYPFQVASIINKDNFGLIESISPYIFGIQEQYTNSFFTDNEIESNEIEILCVDIDNQNVILKNNCGSFPKFPKKLINQFEKNYDEFMKKITSKNKKEKKIVLTNKNSNYADFTNIVFDFMVSLLKNYQKFLNYDYFSSSEHLENASIYTLFQVENFLNSYSSGDREFFSRFVESQMFSDFIYKIMFPKNTQEKIDILFINEKITDNFNKSLYFPKNEKFALLYSNDYNLKNKYIVPKQNELTQSEKSLLSKKSISYLERGQIIKKKNDDTFGFHYYIFPEFLDEVFFNSTTVLSYFPQTSFQEEIDGINGDVLSKSTYNLNAQQSNTVEMLNYIYLSWLEIWAFSFAYTKKQEERENQFNQMMVVLDKVIHHEMPIFNILFEVLSQEKEDQMIKALYSQMIINYKLNPSIFIHQIGSKLLDFKEIRAIKFRKIKTFKDPSNNGKVPILPKSKRTFKLACEDVVLEEIVKFNNISVCEVCGNKFDLLAISKDFSQMRKDVLWAKCQQCQESFIPKLKIRLGKELNIENDSSEIEGKTSTTDEVVLYSPHDLKVNLKEGIYREYGINLDVSIFKLKFNALFWNCIWYFWINDLPYDFFLPYEESFKIQNVNQVMKNKSNCNIDVSLKGGVFDIFLKYCNMENKESNGAKILRLSLLDGGVNKMKKKIKSFKNLEITRECIDPKMNIVFSSASNLTNYYLATKNDESVYINVNSLRENTIYFDSNRKYNDFEQEIGSSKEKPPVYSVLNSIKGDKGESRNKGIMKRNSKQEENLQKIIRRFNFTEILLESTNLKEKKSQRSKSTMSRRTNNIILEKKSESKQSNMNKRNSNLIMKKKISTKKELIISFSEN